MSDTIKRSLLYSISFAMFALLFSVLSIALGLLAGETFAAISDRDSASAASVDPTAFCFVLDAGHGGEDGGAIAADGTEEAELNLQIAENLCALLRLNGNSVTMTRTEDTLLYDYYNDLTDYTGQKKMYDLRNRLKITNEQKNAVYVGIHMNKFTDPQYSGLQVYYSSASSLSRNLAGMIQMNVRTSLQPENDRPIKAAGSGIYLLRELTVPAVLVECGFLSNPEECATLNTGAYRGKLATVLFLSLCNFECADGGE